MKEAIAQTKSVLPDRHQKLLYQTVTEDQTQASAELVATVVAGYSSLDVQQRVVDAGFTMWWLRLLVVIKCFFIVPARSICYRLL